MKLEVKDLRKSFGETEVLHGVSFSVESGRALGLLGRNGAGKTTLMKSILGFHPYQGEILLDGEKLPQIDKTRLWLYYKPVGLVTTHKDEQNRETVFANLPPYMPRVISVGRLDLNSEGLLLLTNDGELANLIMHPKNEIDKVYVAKISGILNPKELMMLKNGVIIDGVKKVLEGITNLQELNNKLDKLEKQISICGFEDNHRLIKILTLKNQLKHKIIRKSLNITLYSLVESSCFNTIELRKVAI